MSAPSNEAAIQRAQQCARFFRRLGYNPLPSKMDVKGPMLPSYAEYWDQPLPEEVFEDWSTTNIQLMCGTHWRLCVVDCDGEEAHCVWREMKNAGGFEGPMPTWIVKTGGGGWHYYFRLPEWLDECPSRRLWGVWDTWLGPKHQGDWRKHQEVRLLGDRSLVIAPPSLHVQTGNPYEFLPGRGPKEIPRPAEAPPWLLAMPAIVNPRTVEELKPYTPPRPRTAPTGPPGAFYGRDEVLAAVTEKARLAQTWGLRLASQGANRKGWVACHAIDREDATPSASFHERDGVYWEAREGRRLSFFDLAVALGVYPTWQDAVADLGARYNARLAG